MADSSVDADVDNRPQEEAPMASLEALEQRYPTCLPEEEGKPYIGRSTTLESSNDNDDDDASDEDDTNNDEDEDEDEDDVSSLEEGEYYSCRYRRRPSYIENLEKPSYKSPPYPEGAAIVSARVARQRQQRNEPTLFSAAADGDMAMARASSYSNNSDDDDDDDDHEKDEAMLLSLVNKGRFQNVKVLLESKPHLIQTKTSKGETILHLAAANGHLDTVKHLLRIIIPKKNKSGEEEEEEEIINHDGRRLIRAKSWDGDTALHAAAQSGHIGMVKQVVRVITKLLKEEKGSKEEKPPLLEANWYGDTAVHVALKKGSNEVASYLIKKQPEVAYQVNLDSESPLFLAVKGNHHDLVEDLFKVLPGKDVDRWMIKRIARPETPIVNEALHTRNLGNFV